MMLCRHNTKRNEPMGSSSIRRAWIGSTRFTRIGSFLLIALFLMMCAGCSSKPSPARTPTLPANLAAPCPPLPQPPSPLIDPARTIWEATLIALYGDCARRHVRTVDAIGKS